MAKLEKSKAFEGVKGPLLTLVMDGVGIAPANAANAVAAVYDLLPLLEHACLAFLHA